MSKRVLVIEDNRDLAELVALHLRDLTSGVDIVNDGEKGLAMLEKESYDLLILDLMLPGMEGLEVCRRLRSDKVYIPVLILTAKSSEVDRVLGLEMGADDYLTKPFSIRELVARVKAIFRRIDLMTSQAPEEGESVIKRGGLVIDSARRKVTVDGESVTLTSREFDLLMHFARHPGRVYRRTQLLDQIWGYSYAGYEHTVNSHINRLRAKIEKDPAEPRYIQTVWGVGYKFSDTEL